MVCACATITIQMLGKGTKTIIINPLAGMDIIMV